MTRSEARRVFGRRLQESRLARGKTQKTVAAESGIPLPTYQGYEQGRSFPTAARLAVLCQVLVVHPDRLLPHNWTKNSDPFPRDISGDPFAIPANRIGD